MHLYVVFQNPLDKILQGTNYLQSSFRILEHIVALIWTPKFIKFEKLQFLSKLPKSMQKSFRIDISTNNLITVVSKSQDSNTTGQAILVFESLHLETTKYYYFQMQYWSASASKLQN